MLCQASLEQSPTGLDNHPNPLTNFKKETHELNDEFVPGLENTYVTTLSPPPGTERLPGPGPLLPPRAPPQASDCWRGQGEDGGIF